jgi:phosphoserine phosphatase
MAPASNQNQQTHTSQYTGLILISGPDQPGLSSGLMKTLAPFSVTVLETAQILIRGRLIATTLITLNRDHASAIESDLLEFAESCGVDLALDFADLNPPITTGRQYRAIVVANPLIPAALAHVTDALVEAGGKMIGIRPLGNPDVTAVEMSFHFPEAITDQQLPSRELTQLLVPLGASLSIQESRSALGLGRIIMLDVDSTLIAQEVIDQLAAKFGVGEEVSAITESAMRGELDFESSLRKRVALLAGAPASIIDEVRVELTLTPGARTLIATAHKLGFKVGVVSGGFTNIVDSLATELALDFHRANTLEIQDGKLTGGLLGPIITRAGKAQALREFADRESVPLESTVAIGDGANDLDMLDIAGLGIAFCAKPAVVAAADCAIHAADLSRALYLLGVSEAEMIRID